MKAAIRKRARELGFDDCRITTAQPPESGPRFAHWLAEGRQGEMGYLQRNAPKRLDPQQTLPGARSIITLAVSYAESEGRGPSFEDGKRNTDLAFPLTPALSRRERESPRAALEGSNDPRFAGRLTAIPPLPEGEGRGEGEQEPGLETTSNVSKLNCRGTGHAGLIARYARFTDYHDVIGARLKLLTEFVDQLGGEGTRSLWYVDTGPLLERDLAQRSGLGFIGKHTNLIGRKLGNWLFLAEILSTLKLEPDAPETNRCGSCTRCMAACPTAAITEPFQLDARRCISYLTIELKGPIPVELRPAIGNRIYGCDDCLAVCPWNRFAREGRMMKAHARRDLETPDLMELLKLDEAGFRQRLAGTPLLRGNRKGLLRNVCVALGNVGDEKALGALQKAWADPEPLIAEHARWAIEQIRARMKS